MVRQSTVETDAADDAEQLQVALAFASLEILELKAGTRGLTQCPGLKNLGRHIAQAEANPPWKRGTPGHTADCDCLFDPCRAKRK